MNYKEQCMAKIKTMSIETYNKFCSVIMAAQRGDLSWEDLWKKHLKDAGRVSLHG